LYRAALLLSAVRDLFVLPFYGVRFVVKRVWKRLVPYSGPRSEIRTFDVQPGVYLSVFWKVVVNGVGPGIVCVVADDEVLRFDCFGKGDGHYHILPKAETVRLRFAEETVEEQIDRAAFELTANLAAHLRRSPNPLVRWKRIDREKLATAVEAARRAALSLQHSRQQ
jgi:hypothetical protein